MAAKTKSLDVAPGSELDQLLDSVDVGPVLLNRAGRQYRVERVERLNVIEPQAPDDIWIGYDPEALGKAILEAAGSWSDVDTEAFKDEIYRDREQSGRSRKLG